MTFTTVTVARTYGPPAMRDTFWYLSPDICIVDGVEWPKMTRQETGGAHVRHIFKSPCGRYVLKSQRCTDRDASWTQCFREARMWEDIAEQDRCYFAAVVAHGLDMEHGYAWDVQERIGSTGGTVEEGHVLPKDEHEILSWIVTAVYEVGDWMSRQYKVVDGHPVVHDYGY